MHMWLRFRAWYRRRLRVFALAALLLPTLAVLGVVNAGWDTVLHAAMEPGFAAAHGPPAPDSPFAAAGPGLATWAIRLQLTYLAILCAVLALRETSELARTTRRRDSRRLSWRPKRSGAAGLFGAGGESLGGHRARLRLRRARALLDMSRAGLARPRTGAAAAPAELGDLATRRRAGWRAARVSVAPERRYRRRDPGPAGATVGGLGVALEEGREVSRDGSVRRSSRFDATGCGSAAVRRDFHRQSLHPGDDRRDSVHNGHITSIAGDGIMSVFGLDGDARSGARRALVPRRMRGARSTRSTPISRAEIGSPLRFGIGAHTGATIFGAVGPLDRSSLQFLGDTGNVAARLEGLTKERGCGAIVSAATVEAADWPGAEGHRARLEIRGRGEISANSRLDGRRIPWPSRSLSTPARPVRIRTTDHLGAGQKKRVPDDAAQWSDRSGQGMKPSTNSRRKPMKTFTTIAVVASFLAVAPAYAHSHMSTPFQGGNGGANMGQISRGGDGGSSMGQISQGGNGTHTGNMTDGRHDDRWTRDTDKVTDRRHDDRFRHVDSERRDRVRILERELARLLHRDVDGRNSKFVQLEIRRLRFEILKLEHELMIADVS